jgi:predicted amidohydrolase
MQDIRLAAMAVNPRHGDIEANFATVQAWTRRAAAAGAGLVVFPEGFLTGYDLDLLPGAAVERDGEAINRVASLAEDLGLIISIGFLERDARGCYVAQAHLGRGQRHVHRKCHRTPWERQHCLAGDELAVHDLGPVKVGTLICYDSAFPAASETLARRGAELILSPTCHAADGTELSRLGRAECLRRRRRHVHLYWRARAYDYTVFTCYVDNAGETAKGEWFPGHAAVFAPDGECLAEHGTGEEGMLVVDLPAHRLAEARRDRVGHFHVLADARPELYGP